MPNQYAMFISLTHIDSVHIIGLLFLEDIHYGFLYA